MRFFLLSKAVCEAATVRFLIRKAVPFPNVAGLTQPVEQETTYFRGDHQPELVGAQGKCLHQTVLFLLLVGASSTAVDMLHTL